MDCCGESTAQTVDRHRDMERWGVYSLFKESGRLLYRHIRTIRPFILAFLLPLALILLLEVIGIAWVFASIAWLMQLVQREHLGGVFGYYHRRHSTGFHALHIMGFFKAPIPFQPNFYSIIKLITHTYSVIFLTLFITWLLVRLANTSSSFQTLTLVHSIFTTLPHFVYRIFILFLCFLVVDIFTFFIVAFPFYLFSGLPQLFPYPLETVTICVSYFLFLILDSWFEVSVQVAVLRVY